MNSTNLSPETENCYSHLRDNLADLGSMLIAFSGGTDSTLLLETASRINNISVIAVTVNSVLLPAREIENATEYIKTKNIPHIIIEADPLEVKEIYENSTLRCYHCKKYIFQKIKGTALINGVPHVLDGTHHDDLSDYRPGLMAISELGILSPLRDAGFKKQNIRELARYFKLNNWASPAYPCLATRIPHGTPLAKDDLLKIEKAESFIQSLGFNQVRVRLHGDTARIEIPPERIDEIVKNTVRLKISDSLKSLGFRFIALDLEGYRTGSMNIVTDGEAGG